MASVRRSWCQFVLELLPTSPVLTVIVTATGEHDVVHVEGRAQLLGPGRSVMTAYDVSKDRTGDRTRRRHSSCRCRARARMTG